MRRYFRLGSSSTAMLWLLSQRQVLLVLMFTLLHAALLQDVTTSSGRIFMLLHFAMFLLWQPFVNAQSTVDMRQIALMALALAFGSVWISWWSISIWLMLLAGIVGGRVFFYHRRNTKAFYLLALAYLITMLLLFMLPYLVSGALTTDSALQPLTRYGAPALLVVMVLLPESRESGATREAIDLAYSVFIILLLAVISLGTVTLMLLQKTDYVQALLTTLFATATTLAAASWLWNPVAGFSGLGVVASRYMLSIGLPFEQWLRSLTELAQQEPDPYLFLDTACQGMVEQLPWVSACSWSSGGKHGMSSSKNATAGKGIETPFRQGDLILTLITQQSMAPAVVWHFNLVAQLVARFYIEKKRDLLLREMAYMQAVHETGARVTHDVKNLLQSLNALLYLVSDTKQQSDSNLQLLLQRQLPLISQRLQQTLEKLRVPDADVLEIMPADSWWRDLCSRYEGRDVRFEAQGDLSELLPTGLFNSAAENLIQNALDKRALEPQITITVKLHMRKAAPLLSVMDTGLPLPPDRAADVCARPLASENGLGIGLYQLARVAVLSNYLLKLSTNQPGEVCFTLGPRNS